MKLLNPKTIKLSDENFSIGEVLLICSTPYEVIAVNNGNAELTQTETAKQVYDEFIASTIETRTQQSKEKIKQDINRVIRPLGFDCHEVETSEIQEEDLIEVDAFVGQDYEVLYADSKVQSELNKKGYWVYFRE